MSYPGPGMLLAHLESLANAQLLVGLQIAAWILLAMILVIVAIQSASVSIFVRLLVKYSRPMVSRDQLPPAAIVLAIRGPDPFLADTLQALLKQDYPEFLISIVIDDRLDPARKIVEAVIRSTGATNIRVSVLRHRRVTCSLKCSSLIQAVEDLDEKFEVVAFIDGDVKPHPQWLRDLASPLADPKVGVVTGNRWYRPEVGNWGSLVRYFWNAGAVVQVWFNDIVWAGSMALRRDCIERVDLLNAWSHALADDTAVYCQLQKHGLRVQFAPSVLMVNPEHIGLSSFRGWVRRQLVCAKHCSDGWAVVLFHGMYLACTQLLGMGLLVAALALGNYSSALIAASAMALYWLASIASAAALEYGVHRITSLNDQSSQWMSALTLLKLVPAMILTHIVYTQDLIAANFCRRVSWRGVDYAILGKNDIRMVSYHPFHESSAKTNQTLTSVV
jgi:cellulose synthase/poly-beta-1,6-N-acetylglucosamine synthase-like glycosyltransferase